jgi:positive regulator of sigma E activity
MMKERVALVLSTNDDKTAKVATDPKGICRGCKDTGKCRMCLAGTRHVTTVKNSVGASKGDVVFIYNVGSALWSGTVSLYVIPALWLMIGAIIGAGLGVDWKIGEAGGAVLVGMSGFAVGLLVVLVISKMLKLDLEISPRIVRIIDPFRKAIV